MHVPVGRAADGTRGLPRSSGRLRVPGAPPPGGVGPGGTDAAAPRVLGGVQRHGSGGSAAIRYRVAGLVLLFVHLAIVGWLTLRPLDVMWVTAANWEPLAGIRADLAQGPVEAARRIAGGLLLLAPLGVLLPLADARLDVALWASLLRTAAGARWCPWGSSCCRPPCRDGSWTWTSCC